jgi:hypothetical protein
MPAYEPGASSIILYQTEDGRTRIEGRFEGEPGDDSCAFGKRA